MTKAPIPPEEAGRLAKLRSYEILDSPSERDYHEIAHLAAQICGTPLSTISFVDQDRQWFKEAIGIVDRETSRDVAFCAHTILSDKVLVVEDASGDARFMDNPLVTAEPRIRFYAGAPLITPDGYRLGALCAIDRKPHALTEEQIRSLQILARHVVDLLELRRSRRELEVSNRELNRLSDLKSRLMAIMAHDLRSPMATISSITTLFRDVALSDAEKQAILRDLDHVLDATKFLLDNVIGWATRSLDTTPLEFSRIEPDLLCRELADSLDRDLDSKSNRLVVNAEGATPICSDRNILVFVIRNLLANANKFTATGTVTLRATRSGDTAIFSVADTGTGMTPARKEGLFDWSVRSRSVGTNGEKGAGVALLFCWDFIARLGGTLTVESEPGSGTTMTVRIPAEPAPPADCS